MSNAGTIKINSEKETRRRYSAERLIKWITEWLVNSTDIDIEG